MSNPLSWVWNNVIKSHSDAWQAISAIIMAIFTFMLYRVGNHTNQLSEATQKALISFGGTAGGVALASPDHKTRIAQEILFNWSNSGTTQARNAVTAVNGEAWPTELPQGFDFPDLPGSQKQTISIGPKETGQVRTAVAISQFATTWEGKAHLYSWGWIVYDDIFTSRSHLTEFCIEFIQIAPMGQGKTGADLTDPNVPFSWNIQKCKQHNCYDDDCKDYSDRIKQARE